MTAQSAADGLPVGTKTRSMGRTIGEGEFSLLNTLTWSTSELHTNAEAMRSSEFGERLLAGPALIGLTAGLYDSSEGRRLLQEEHGVRVRGMLSFKARYRNPVLPGDTLWVDTELVGAESHGGGEAGAGVVTFRDVTVNQRDQTVLELEREILFDRVDPAGEA